MALYVPDVSFQSCIPPRQISGAMKTLADIAWLQLAMHTHMFAVPRASLALSTANRSNRNGSVEEFWAKSPERAG